jgi:hypothetical protein
MVDPPGDVTGWDAMVGVKVNSAALFLDLVLGASPFNTVHLHFYHNSIRSILTGFDWVGLLC